MIQAAGTTDGGNVAEILRIQNAAVREVVYYLALPGMDKRLGKIVADDACVPDEGQSLLEALRREALALDDATGDA